MRTPHWFAAAATVLYITSPAILRGEKPASNGGLEAGKKAFEQGRYSDAEAMDRSVL
jgi:hypothetical protein